MGSFLKSPTSIPVDSFLLASPGLEHLGGLLHPGVKASPHQ